MLWCIVSGGEGKKVPSNQNYSCELNFTMVCPSLWSYKPQTKAGSWWAEHHRQMPVQRWPFTAVLTFTLVPQKVPLSLRAQLKPEVLQPGCLRVWLGLPAKSRWGSGSVWTKDLLWIIGCCKWHLLLCSGIAGLNVFCLEKLELLSLSQG